MFLISFYRDFKDLQEGPPRQEPEQREAQFLQNIKQLGESCWKQSSPNNASVLLCELALFPQIWSNPLGTEPLWNRFYLSLPTAALTQLHFFGVCINYHCVTHSAKTIIILLMFREWYGCRGPGLEFGR